MKIFPSIEFFSIFTTVRQSVTCVRNAKKLRVSDFVSEIKCVENYPDFEKLVDQSQHGLQGFIVKNIEGESTEANDISHIL